MRYWGILLCVWLVMFQDLRLYNALNAWHGEIACWSDMLVFTVAEWG